MVHLGGLVLNNWVFEGQKEKSLPKSNPSPGLVRFSGVCQYRYFTVLEKGQY